MSNESLLDDRRDLAPIVGGILLIAYILGYLYPDQWWGTHQLAFIPQMWMGIILGIAGCLIAAPLFLKNGISLNLKWTPQNNLLINLLVPLGFTSLGFLIPMTDDNYGHATNYTAFLNEPIQISISEALEPVFSLNFSPGQGRQAGVGLTSAFASLFKLTLNQTFYFLGLLCYFLYNFVWIRFAQNYFKRASTKCLMVTMASTAPLIQVFLGHAETYSIVYLLLTTIILTILMAYRNPKKKYVWWMLIYLFIGLRFHGFFLLLIPATILTCLRILKPNHTTTQKIHNPKGITLYALIPLLAVGATIYFAILQGHSTPRQLSINIIGDQLFLPISTTEPPLDRYNLLSGYHLFDYINAIFLWSPPALLIIGIVLRAYRKSIDWKQPAILTVSLTLLLAMLMLFMNNPIHSMPMDWDLYSFAGPILLALTAIILAQLEPDRIANHLIIPVLGLTVLSLPMLFVNASTFPHSHRLESVAKHSFRTYYSNAGEYLQYAQMITSPDAEAYLERQARYLNELKPDARFQNDPVYHNLLVGHALRWEALSSQPDKVRNTFLEAELYGKLKPEFIPILLENHLRLGDHSQANFRAGQLIEYDIPSREEALQKGIQTALKVEDYDQASNRCQAYLKLRPRDSTIMKINDLLNQEAPIEEIILLLPSTFPH